MPGLFTTFTNCRLCIGGELIEGKRLVVNTDEEGGKILESTGFIGGEIVDLDDAIIAPGFLELQAMGVNGFHFSSFEDQKSYESKMVETGKFYAKQGITGFYATIPTTTAERYQKVGHEKQCTCKASVDQGHSRFCHRCLHEISKMVHHYLVLMQKDHTYILRKLAHTIQSSFNQSEHR